MNDLWSVNIQRKRWHVHSNGYVYVCFCFVQLNCSFGNKNSMPVFFCLSSLHRLAYECVCRLALFFFGFLINVFIFLALALSLSHSLSVCLLNSFRIRRPILFEQNTLVFCTVADASTEKCISASGETDEEHGYTLSLIAIHKYS